MSADLNDRAEHSRAFEHLVSSEDDLIGLIAYALYKKDKRDFVLGWREKSGSFPTVEHAKAFSATVLTLGQQIRYRTAARDMIDAYAQSVLEAERPLVEKSAVAERIEAAAKRVEETARWHRQLPAGLTAAVVLAVLIVGVLMVMRMNGMEPGPGLAEMGVGP